MKLLLLILSIVFASCNTVSDTKVKAKLPISYGVYNSNDSGNRAFKDSIIWQMLVVNPYARAGVEMCHVASGEPIYDIAEKYAIGVMNDHPNATQLQNAVDTAILMMMFIELGLVPERVGSTIYGQ